MLISDGWKSAASANSNRKDAADAVELLRGKVHTMSASFFCKLVAHLLRLFPTSSLIDRADKFPWRQRCTYLPFT